MIPWWIVLLTTDLLNKRAKQLLLILTNKVTPLKEFNSREEPYSHYEK
jgi:hypothetical protein